VTWGDHTEGDMGPVSKHVEGDDQAYKIPTVRCLLVSYVVCGVSSAVRVSCVVHFCRAFCVVVYCRPCVDTAAALLCYNFLTLSSVQWIHAVSQDFIAHLSASRFMNCAVTSHGGGHCRTCVFALRASSGFMSSCVAHRADRLGSRGVLQRLRKGETKYVDVMPCALCSRWGLFGLMAGVCVFPLCWSGWGLPPHASGDPRFVW
jgi:hypothetical protein